ncbi:hypothetical protein LAZ67_2005638 [Cordylochernes scorpioides]|uniref:Uncharacterized protein n=1 Tax=Cordylochernes scorpioides TaxID=51811 RepID=A0ABY6K962_9ARAC|nr:hypothetical protein LAZ67_2005638 [Cordylochernes scorpioides]
MPSEVGVNFADLILSRTSLNLSIISRQSKARAPAQSFNILAVRLFLLYQCLAERFVLITNICQEFETGRAIGLKRLVGLID